MATDAKTREAIYHGAPSVGLRNVGSYQISGHPFLTGTTGDGAAGTEVKIGFPFVTKNITIIASGTHGAAAGAGTQNSFKIHFNSCLKSSRRNILFCFSFLKIISKNLLQNLLNKVSKNQVRLIKLKTICFDLTHLIERKKVA